MQQIKLRKNIVPVVQAVVKSLKNGSVVIAPTDTVYGLLADATNRDAVQKLLAFKNRPAGKPISVFLPDIKSITQYVSPSALDMQTLNTILPGPFTVVLPSKGKVRNELESERGTLGIRIPQNVFINKVCASFGGPITATSANLAGEPPHYSLTALLKRLSQKKKELITLAVDGGVLQKNKPSTVVDLTTPEITVLRSGDITFSSQRAGFKSESAFDTADIAQLLLNKYLTIWGSDNKPIIFLLNGALGAGKTVFAKSIARAFGVSGVISPTYVISIEYDIENKPYNKFVHYDLYNLFEINEFEHIGITDYLNEKNILVIEWAEKCAPILPILKKHSHIVSVTIDYDSATSRLIRAGAVH